ncbi:O-antigen/teichoic acid export membrane protein [Idiomarina fontislapidosi]|uniref:Flippase n=1 Tax=Idiomarina fontislapidosi TaxID=263723 RepID=A0A432XN03_9GAMM|nr:lipopolysaccharide biosynthesis protein [Idiomarina fontislapidosi]PYE30413.1 O-antigen/teichoic acid export membrane protein [Idiomarina fontislapidosi]RUO50086.1 flippase [Idiomarina fontislapidosi]
MNLKRKAITGVKWSFVQQFSVQVINFSVQVILARLLMPEMFGLIAMVIVFISIGTALMDGGMTSSLIRTKNPEQVDYSTVFVTNLIVSILIYVVVYLSAPYIAIFYEQEVLTDVIRLLAVSFVIKAFVAVHVAKLTKEMNFKLQMQLQLPSTFISGTVGVTMASIGFGVWSLVWLNLVQAIVFTVQSWVFIPWKPSLIFDKSIFRRHFKFGYKLTIASLIDTIYNDAYRIVIGKFFTPAQVGYFHHADTLRLFPVQQISAVVGKVSYPFFSDLDCDKALKMAYQKLLKLLLIIVIPLMLSLILIAEPGFRFIFGEKWLPAVPYFQILAIVSIFRPVSAYNLNILKVKGRSDVFLILEVLKKIAGVAFLIGGVYFGIIGLVLSFSIFSIVSYVVDMYFGGRKINYEVWEQISDIYPLLKAGFVSFIASFSLKAVLSDLIQSDFLQIITFGGFLIISFYAALYLFCKETFGLIKILSGLKE